MIPVFKIKTPAEIVARISDIGESDLLGFGRQALIGSLPFDHAQEFLKDEAAAEEWDVELSRDAVVGEMVSYLGFAREKAWGHPRLGRTFFGNKNNVIRAYPRHNNASFRRAIMPQNTKLSTPNT